jgi:hypothetical protein
MKKTTLPEGEMKMPEENFGTAVTQTHPSYIGIVLGILIIVLVLILAGLYMWGEMLKKQQEQMMFNETMQSTTEENNGPESQNTEASTTLSTSDEINAIEADLDSTDLDDLDAEFTAIDAELEASITE